MENLELLVAWIGCPPPRGHVGAAVLPDVAGVDGNTVDIRRKSNWSFTRFHRWREVGIVWMTRDGKEDRAMRYRLGAGAKRQKNAWVTSVSAWVRA